MKSIKAKFKNGEHVEVNDGNGNWTPGKVKASGIGGNGVFYTVKYDRKENGTAYTGFNIIEANVRRYETVADVKKALRSYKKKVDVFLAANSNYVTFLYDHMLELADEQQTELEELTNDQELALAELYK